MPNTKGKKEKHAPNVEEKTKQSAEEREYAEFLRRFSEGNITDVEELERELAKYLVRGWLARDAEAKQAEAMLALGYCLLNGVDPKTHRQDLDAGYRLVAASFEARKSFQAYFLLANCSIRSEGTCLDVNRCEEYLTEAQRLNPENHEALSMLDPGSPTP